jgi:hypothetical protein
MYGEMVGWDAGERNESHIRKEIKDEFFLISVFWAGIFSFLSIFAAGGAYKKMV